MVLGEKMRILRSLFVAGICTTVFHMPSAYSLNIFNSPVETPSEAQAACSGANAEYAKTKYPVVFVHGMGGFSSKSDDDQYWYRIPQDIRRCGNTQVFEVDVSGFNTEEVRGEQLKKQVESILSLTGAKKVNLIGHSQGGLTARYLAAVAPKYIVSITTIGTPHKGSLSAKLGFWTGINHFVLKKDNEKNGTSDSFDAQLYKIMNDPNFSIESDYDAQEIADAKERMALPQNSDAALSQLTPHGMKKFNKKYPSPGVPDKCEGRRSEVNWVEGNVHYLYSWTGNKVVTLGKDVDPMDQKIKAASAVFLWAPNDGLVGVCSADFGKRIGVYPWNHLDEINGTRGLVGPGESPVVVIRNHVNRLKKQGL